MFLHKGTQDTVDRITHKITALLNAREKKWDVQQKEKLKERIDKKSKDNIKKLLTDCKSWFGPCTSMDELLHATKPDRAEFIVKTEMTYDAQTHEFDKIQRPDLYKINGITHEEKLENLMILLSDDDQGSTASVANLPFNDAVFTALDQHTIR